jgi:hypothetical protein
MSRTIETTSTPDVLSQAESRTNGQGEREVCRKRANAKKVGVITGASTAMGLGTAKRFRQEGVDDVFMTGRRRDVTGALRRLFKDEGIEVVLNASIQHISGKSGDDVQVVFGDSGREKTKEGTHLLAASRVRFCSKKLHKGEHHANDSR